MLFQILESDPYSKRMCHSCCFKLHSARMFVDMVHKSDRELKELDNDMDKETDKDSTGECWPKPIQLDKNVNDAVFGNVQDPHLIQIKEEILSDDDNFDANAADCNLDLDIKIEPEEITESTPIKITVNGKYFFLIYICIPINNFGPGQSSANHWLEVRVGTLLRRRFNNTYVAPSDPTILICVERADSNVLASRFDSPHSFEMFEPVKSVPFSLDFCLGNNLF